MQNNENEEVTPIGEEKEQLGFENTDEEIEEAEKEGSNAEEVQKLKEALLRNAADYENFKKRKEAEINKIREYASEKVIKDIFPIYEDLSRSIDSVNKGETTDVETLQKGIQAIHEKFKNVLISEGVEEINSLGKEFDVDVNEALVQIPREDVPENTVIEVIEKGYKQKGKVVKHEKVIVSKKPE